MENESKNVKLSLEPNPQGAMRLFISLVLIALFVFLVVEAKNAFDRGGKDVLGKNTITVSADAKRLVAPDIALVSFTIHKEDASLKVVRDQVSTLSDKVVEFLKSNGVDAKDIKTAGYNMYPNERYDGVYYPCVMSSDSSLPCPPRKSTKTYIVEETFEVKIRNLEKAGDLIAGVSTQGVNQVGSLRFTVDDARSEQLRKEARQEAIAKAREDASSLAKSLGVRIVALVSFNEGGNQNPIFYAKGMGGSSFDSVAAPAPSIAPGENEITSNVSITYEVR